MPSTNALRRRLAAASLIVPALALAAPGAASAKTFKAVIADPQGDATDDGIDLVSARLAYNRRSGAISASITFAQPISTAPDDAAFAIFLSDLRGGKCHTMTAMVIADLADPGRVGAVVITKSRSATGRGTIDDATFSFRIRSRRLAGLTPGCVGIRTIHDQPTQSGDTPFLYADAVDETRGDDGFL